MKKNINIYKLLCIVLAVVLVVVVGIMIYRSYTQNKAGDIYDNLQTQVNDMQQPVDTDEVSEEPETEPEEENRTEDEVMIEIPEKSLDWGMLRAINNSIYAWIYIPETKVDYPVLQHPDDDDYFLNHNMDGTYGYPGCIYTQMLNKKDFSDFNTILYGHNMKDGTMFRTLHYYENEEFFYHNPYIFIYTEEDVLVYEVFAAYNGGEEHIINANDFDTDEGKAAYLEKVRSDAAQTGYYKEDIELDGDSHILSLSTCSDLSDERYLVLAVLVSDTSDEEELFGEEDSPNTDIVPEGTTEEVTMEGTATQTE